MATKISKYTFEEVEGKLDIIKNNQGADKVLLGDGTYGDYPDVTQYVTVTQLESAVEEKVEQNVQTIVDTKVEEAVKDQVTEATDSDIDSLFQ